MSRALRACAVSACLGLATGCVYVAWGRYPVPTNVAVEEVGWSRWRVAAPDVDATIELGDYNPRILFWGLIVPVVPLPWFTDSDFLEVRIDAAAPVGSPFYRAEQVRLRFPDSSREPLVAKISSRMDRWEPGDAAPESVRFAFTFDVPPPREPFSLEIDGLPRFDLDLRSRFTGAIGQP